VVTGETSSMKSKDFLDTSPPVGSKKKSMLKNDERSLNVLYNQCLIFGFPLSY
jgi:hypothetical protein